MICQFERNAAGQVRLLEAAETGDPAEQYPAGGTGRRAEIDAGSRRHLDDLMTFGALEQRLYGLNNRHHLAERPDSDRGSLRPKPAESCNGVVLRGLISNSDIRAAIARLRDSGRGEEPVREDRSRR
jgi:hypothetical protein